MVHSAAFQNPGQSAAGARQPHVDGRRRRCASLCHPLGSPAERVTQHQNLPVIRTQFFQRFPNTKTQLGGCRNRFRLQIRPWEGVEQGRVPCGHFFAPGRVAQPVSPDRQQPGAMIDDRGAPVLAELHKSLLQCVAGLFGVATMRVEQGPQLSTVAAINRFRNRQTRIGRLWRHVVFEAPSIDATQTGTYPNTFRRETWTVRSRNTR